MFRFPLYRNYVTNIFPVFLFSLPFFFVILSVAKNLGVKAGNALFDSPVF